MEGKEMQSSTFIVQVKCMEHDTWQGTLTWAEKNRSQYFRSTLELLKLMDRALTDRSLHGEELDEEEEE